MAAIPSRANILSARFSARVRRRAIPKFTRKKFPKICILHLTVAHLLQIIGCASIWRRPEDFPPIPEDFPQIPPGAALPNRGGTGRTRGGAVSYRAALPFYIAYIAGGSGETMSDDTTVMEIERHNIICWQRFREYWRKQGVNIDVTDPTKPITATDFVAGLPRGYRGEDAIRVKRG